MSLYLRTGKAGVGINWGVNILIYNINNVVMIFTA